MNSEQGSLVLCLLTSQEVMSEIHYICIIVLGEGNRSQFPTLYIASCGDLCTLSSTLFPYDRKRRHLRPKLAETWNIFELCDKQ